MATEAIVEIEITSACSGWTASSFVLTSADEDARNVRCQIGAMMDIDTINHETHMKEALKEAQTALDRGDRPVGCVIVHNGEVVARGSNHEFTMRSKFEHAETRTLRSCAQYLYANSNECILYTTVEPCVMCLGAIVMANIRHVIYGAPDPVCGGTDMYKNVGYVRRSLRGCYIGGVLAIESEQLRDAFKNSQ